MPTITITLSAEHLFRLEDLARKVNVTPEEFVRARVEEWLTRPEDDFARAADYVLQKNRTLYQQLS